MKNNHSRKTYTKIDKNDIQMSTNNSKKDSRRKPQWSYVTVELIRSKSFGFAFEHVKSSHRTDNTISISKIVPGGVADKDGRLRIGDIIVSVNHVKFDEVPHNEAIETLKCSGPYMIMVVKRQVDVRSEEEDNQSEEEDIPSDEVDNKSGEEDNESVKSESQSEESYEDASNFYQFQVILKKESQGLGINIHGGYDGSDDTDTYVSISKLIPNGAAYRDGHLKVGDIILQVDSHSFHGLTFDECVDILKNTGKTVTIYAGRFLQKTQKTSNTRRARNDS